MSGKARISTSFTCFRPRQRPWGQTEPFHDAVVRLGPYPRYDSRLVKTYSFADAARTLAASSDGLIACGNGRAYGDAAIGFETSLSTLNLDHMRSFDPATGRVTVEAGVMLGDIIETFLPRGFFPSVVPGTKHVTVGGMIAADVHGKNHHRQGGFGRYIEALTLALPDGEVVPCSRHQNSEIFLATMGGMGLTGVILDATFTMQTVQTGWIMQKTTVSHGIDDVLAAIDATDGDTYSVAWLDAASKGADFGRCLVFAGNHATEDELRSMDASLPLVPGPRRALDQEPASGLAGDFLPRADFPRHVHEARHRHDRDEPCGIGRLHRQ